MTTKKPVATVVKVKPSVHAELQELARSENRAMGDVVADLLQRYRKERFWEEVRASVERLKANPTAWQGYVDEIAEWDALAGDGLEPELPYYTLDEEDSKRY
jgi:hypothetical protein